MNQKLADFMGEVRETKGFLVSHQYDDLTKLLTRLVDLQHCPQQTLELGKLIVEKSDPYVMIRPNRTVATEDVMVILGRQRGNKDNIELARYAIGIAPEPQKVATALACVEGLSKVNRNEYGHILFTVMETFTTLQQAEFEELHIKKCQANAYGRFDKDIENARTLFGFSDC